MGPADYAKYLYQINEIPDVGQVPGLASYKKWDKDRERKKEEIKNRKSFSGILAKEREKEKEIGLSGSFFEAKA